jgi:hypothetical protein
MLLVAWTFTARQAAFHRFAEGLVGIKMALVSAHPQAFAARLLRIVMALSLPVVAFTATDDDLARAAKSPYAIADFVKTHEVSNWAPLWRALEINEHSVQLTPCGLRPECRAELIAVDPLQVILLLRGGIIGWEEVFLRFRRSGSPDEPGPWRLAGHYSNLARQVKPRHELVQLGGGPYLLLTRESQEVGVGWRSVDQIWFDLTAKTFEPVFYLAIEDADSGLMGRVALHSRTKVLSFESQPVERITVAYEVGFGYPFLSAADNGLGSRSAKAVYVRRGAKFVFDAGLSDTPEAEIDKLYNFYVDHLPSNEDLLRYLLPRLKEVASGTNKEHIDWLKNFLTLCEDTPEKRQILARLSRR